jgi:hypothetical protein
VTSCLLARSSANLGVLWSGMNNQPCRAQGNAEILVAAKAALRTPQLRALPTAESAEARRESCREDKESKQWISGGYSLESDASDEFCKSRV